MVVAVLKPFVLACYDTSLGAGRLSADWVPTLNRQIREFPEAKGPVVIYNMGHGGWTSNDLLGGASLVTQLRPTHIFTEGGAINDCVDFGSGPAVSRATHNANNAAMYAMWLAGIPGVDVTLMTMSSVSSIQTARTTLATYYADEIVTATSSLGAGHVLDNYAGWPKPLAQALTYIDLGTGQGDGLHPIWAGAVDTYLYPNVLALARAKMAAFWP